MTVYGIISKLISVVLMQERKIDALREENMTLKTKINRINQYIETYEQYIKGE